MKYLGAVIVFISMVFSVAAQTNPSLEATNVVVGGRRLSLQDCLEQALKHNLDVEIQRYNPEIQLYDLRAAYAGYDPTLNFSGQHQFDVQPGGILTDGLILPSTTSKNDTWNSSIGGTLPWGLQYNFNGNIEQQHFDSDDTGTRSSSGSIGVQLTQPLLKNFWIDSTRLTIRVNKNRLKYTQQGFRNQVITSITAVQTAYYEFVFALENVKVQEEALELSQTQLDQDKQRMQVGTLAQLSVQQDQSQVAQNKANLILAESTLGTDELNLKNLLTDNYQDWENVAIQPTEALTAQPVMLDLQDSWNRAMTERPDLLQARLNVEEDGIQLKYYWNQLFPELDVIGTYGWNGVATNTVYSGTFSEISQGNAPYYSYGAQLTMPLANQGPRNQYKSGKVTLKQAVLQLKQLEQNIMVQVENDLGVVQSDYESVDATREARVYAEEALDAEQKTYAAGKATTFEVLQYQNSVTGARGQEIRALANYEEAIANLSAAEGSTLDKLGITIEVN
jgi:outer membrane protein